MRPSSQGQGRDLNQAGLSNKPASYSLPVPVLMALDTAWELPEVRALGSTVWPVASEMALATACSERAGHGVQRGGSGQQGPQAA